MSATDEYLVSEATKKVGKILELLDTISEDFRNINVQALADSENRVDQHGDLLVLFHEYATNLESNLGSTRLASIIFSAFARTNEEVS